MKETIRVYALCNLTCNYVASVHCRPKGPVVDVLKFKLSAIPILCWLGIPTKRPQWRKSAKRENPPGGEGGSFLRILAFWNKQENCKSATLLKRKDITKTTWGQRCSNTVKQEWLRHLSAIFMKRTKWAGSHDRWNQTPKRASNFTHYTCQWAEMSKPGATRRLKRNGDRSTCQQSGSGLWKSHLTQKHRKETTTGYNTLLQRLSHDKILVLRTRHTPVS